MLKPDEAEEDGIPLVKSQMAGRHGSAPVFIRAGSIREEAQQIAAALQMCHRRGRAWKDMAVLYPVSFVGKELVDVLSQAKIPHDWLQRDRASRKFDAQADTVKVMTMHSSKGLEFPVIALAGVGCLGQKEQHEAEDARLLYVAMTRATEELFMAASRETEFVARLGKWEEAA